MRNVLPVLLAIAMVVATASQVAAQMRSQRQPRGLFGEGVGSAEQLLTMTLSGGAGYDTNVLLSSDDGTTSVGSQSYSLASLSVGYSFSKRYVSASASVQGTAIYPVRNKVSV